MKWSNKQKREVDHVFNTNGIVGWQFGDDWFFGNDGSTDPTHQSVLKIESIRQVQMTDANARFPFRLEEFAEMVTKLGGS